MPEPSIHIDNIEGFVASLDALVETMHMATRRGIAKAGLLVEANTRASFGPAHARGTPKTSEKVQSVTGTLRRTTRLLGVDRMGDTWTARIAPTQPYGRRIELGFHPGDGYKGGVDSLNRHFNQPPYPFLAPGLRKSEPQYIPIMMEAWGAALGF